MATRTPARPAPRPAARAAAPAARPAARPAPRAAAPAPAARPAARPAPSAADRAAAAAESERLRLQAEDDAAAAEAAEQERLDAEAAAGTPATDLDESWEGAEAKDAEDSGFGGGVIPEGGYIFSIVKAYFRKSNTSGLEYVNLELQIIEGEFDGRYLFAPLYINSASDNFRKGQKGFLAKFFEVCVGAVPASLPAIDDDLADLVGTQGWAKVIIEENTDPQGNLVEQNRVVRVRSTDDADAAPEATPAAAAPAARPAARAAAPAARAPAARRAPAAGFADMDDDIPF